MKGKWLPGVLALIFLGGGCKDDGKTPEAVLSVNAHFGYVDKAFTFRSSGSTDTDNEALGLQSRWDFNSDGIWEIPYCLDQAVNYSFSAAGKYTITLEVMDPTGLTDLATDTIRIYGPLPDSAMTDPRDNQVYRIVKINGLWVMAENLRYGQMVTTEMKQTDNQVVEYYAYDNDSSTVHQYGGLYSWWEAMDYKFHTDNQGICPPGWRIPDIADVNRIDIDAPHYFLANYYGIGGVSGFNIDFPGAYADQPVSSEHHSTGPVFYWQGYFASYWNTFHKYQYRPGNDLELLGMFSIDRYISVNSYNGNGFNYTPCYNYRNAPDGYYAIWYGSVRCVSSKY